MDDDTQPRITEADSARGMALRLQGRTWQAIADELGVSRQAVYEWRQREGIDGQLAQMQTDAVDAARARLGALVVKATDVLEALLEPGTEPRYRLAAAREAMRIVFGHMTPVLVPPIGTAGDFHESALRALQDFFVGGDAASQTPPRPRIVLVSDEEAERLRAKRDAGE